MSSFLPPTTTITSPPSVPHYLLKSHKSEVTDLAVPPSFSYLPPTLLLSCSTDRTIRLWDTRTLSSTTTIRPIKCTNPKSLPPSSEFTAVAFSRTTSPTSSDIDDTFSIYSTTSTSHFLQYDLRYNSGPIIVNEASHILEDVGNDELNDLDVYPLKGKSHNSGLWRSRE
ncbi:hypothetical protein TrLO_g8506 [Triparma laevis f. longispina]|uniref:Uncharacterized protein n=1 Tax=Triparma laevis f. longispina TaxID=1714387 RepID=A0A9W7F432_9STRA|nr:hypothetical protein TrLO_g8506 [Triparma laevis f. longispina]